jgi:hypothetical protein
MANIGLFKAAWQLENANVVGRQQSGGKPPHSTVKERV